MEKKSPEPKAIKPGRVYITLSAIGYSVGPWQALAPEPSIFK
jgi:hypothetical protein